MFKFNLINVSAPGAICLLALSCLANASAHGEKKVEQRLEELLEKMTLAEKIGQMIQVNDFDGKIPAELKQALRAGRVGSMLNEIVPETNLEIQRIAREESRLGIPVIMARDVIHGYRTIFPIPLAQSCTWDAELVRKAAAVAAEEAAGAGFHWTFAPMMDIARDPRWGRIAEGFGEDPYVGSIMAAAMVKGFQGNDLSAPTTIAACAKHFVGYGAAEGGRDYNTAWIPEGHLRDVYLPPFKAAVDAGVATVMSSFNELNGIPVTGDKYLLRDVLRSEWGFKGFVVSDWRSPEEMIAHGFCSDLKDVAHKSAHAGIDMEMQSTAYADHLEALVKTGVVAKSRIDDAVRAILRVKFELGLFETPPIYSAALPGKPTAEALNLAKELAAKSTVLLKNDNFTLPLSKNIGSVAVIGPLADDPYEVLGTWNRDGKIEDTSTPLRAIREMIGENKVNYAAGLKYSRDNDEGGISAAVEQAQKSDVALLFVGEEAILSGEAHSRAYLNLPGAQHKLVDAIAAVGKPLVLVVLAGRPLVLTQLAEQADAILYGWHGGTMTGAALADLIFGVESPSGKLTVTFPKAEGQIPVYYAHKNTGRPAREREPLTKWDDIPLRAYQSSLGDASRYLDIGYEPLYPFGYGLSYTTFVYSNLRLSSVKARTGDEIEVKVDLSNTGSVAAEEIAQLYIRDLVGSYTRPVKELKGFQKVRLRPGEKRSLTFELATSQMGFHNRDMKYVVEPGKFHVWVGSDSRTDLRADLELTEWDWRMHR